MSPSNDRQIAQMIARLRQLEQEVSELRLRDAEPTSWIRANVTGQGLFKTPVGGIPAMSGSGPYTWGSAECTVVNEDGTVGSGTETIKNLVNQPIAASVVIKAAMVGSTWFVDTANCGA